MSEVLTLKYIQETRDKMRENGGLQSEFNRVNWHVIYKFVQEHYEHGIVGFGYWIECKECDAKPDLIY